MGALPEIVIDSFAGGGGASEGIERAMRRMEMLGLLPMGVRPIVDIAINHDAKALAMHAANHPRTVHMPCDIWTADPLSTTGGRPVGLLWASPDCRHHSKAKGGRPVSDSVRGLAWVVVHWLEQVAPRVVCLENVEEFQDWGPLVADRNGELRPDPERRGKTFRRWVNRCRALGYKVDWREMRASDHGAPTIRKRLFIIMRRDGEPIVWPPVSHGNPESEHVKSGLLKPWRTAAEIIDWDRPCPSILMSKDEARAYTAATGTRLIRPLAENSERRVARGIKRYVLDAAKPFIVTCNHSGDHFRGQGLEDPFATVTKARDGHGLVMPHVMTMRNSGKPFTAADEPMHTVTAGGAGLSVVSAFMAQHNNDTKPNGASYQRAGRSVAAPMPTVSTAPQQALTEAQMVPFVSYGQQGGHSRPADMPHHTVTASKKDTNTVVAAYVARQFGNSVGSAAEAPIGTVTAGGGGKSQMVAAYLAQHNTDMVGHDVRTPMSTIVGLGSTQGIVAAHMLSLKGSTRRAYGADTPHATVTADGQHSALVSLPLMSAYYSEGTQWADVARPMLTIPTRARFGLVDCPATVPPMTAAQLDSARAVAAFLRKYECWDGGELVTVEIEGQVLVIVDIGMRMLTPRELARAQGFGDDYVLDAPYLDEKTGREKRLTDTDQRHKIGNSVVPQMAEAVIFANYRPQVRAVETAEQAWLLEMPREAAE